jgi:hypothetical protein
VLRVDRYIGYYKTCTTSHANLDADEAIFVGTTDAALCLAEAVTRYRNGEREPGSKLPDPRPK